MPSDARVLLVFHSEEGQTAKIARRVAERLRSAGAAVDLHVAEDAPAPDGYGVVVLGDSIHMVRHSKALARYVAEHVGALNAMRSALFQVSMVSTNPDEEHTAAARKVVDKLLDQTGFSPDVIAMFAGALAYSQYGWVTRRVMHWIARREGHDTDMTRDYEYTQWDAVDRFADDVLTLARTASES